MKNILFILTLLFTSSAFAGNDETSCNNFSISDEISEKVGQKTPFVTYDLEGYVTILFTIDENNILHITQIQSENEFLKNHVLETLDNEKIEYNCAQHDKTYALKLHYIQYS